MPTPRQRSACVCAELLAWHHVFMLNLELIILASRSRSLGRPARRLWSIIRCSRFHRWRHYLHSVLPSHFREGIVRFELPSTGADVWIRCLQLVIRMNGRTCWTLRPCRYWRIIDHGTGRRTTAKRPNHNDGKEWQRWLLRLKWRGMELFAISFVRDNWIINDGWSSLHDADVR